LQVKCMLGVLIPAFVSAILRHPWRKITVLEKQIHSGLQ